MNKYKVHFKNDSTGKVYDKNFSANTFEEAYYEATELRYQFMEAKEKGWRIVGVYEILYDEQKYATLVN